MKVLIIFGTRYGETSSTSEEIGKVLSRKGFQVTILNAKKEKIKDLTEYELVIVGSDMQIDRWTSEAEGFIKRFQKELARKKLALFVSSGIHPIHKHEKNKEAIERAWKKYLEEKVKKYSLTPIELGLFGGVIDYNQMGFIARRTLRPIKEKLEAAGFKETKPGTYDTRNWNEIREWARKLALKARYL